MAFTTKRTAERRRRWTGPFALVVLAYFIVRMGLWHSTWANGVLWQRTLLTGLVADAIALAGLAIMLWARVTLGGNWSGAVVLKEQHELVTSGPYRFVRHPIYSGLFLLLLGSAVWHERRPSAEPRIAARVLGRCLVLPGLR
jgi:protein-S-isoprenylcysteine O-methyltransferase Ste14